MKKILIIAVTTVLFTGCYSHSRNAGRPGDERYMEESASSRNLNSDGPNDRHTQSRTSNNFRNLDMR
jgi:hypothetical protein